MGRPCQHTNHVEGCPLCAWCVIDSPKAMAYRQLWGEREPAHLRKGIDRSKPRVAKGKSLG